MENNIQLRTNEQRSYEVTELWESDRFGDLELQKVQAIYEIIPEDVSSLLDVGCGNGFFLHFLRNKSGDRFQRLCGVDRSQAALNHVQVEAQVGEVHSLPFADSAFDVVVCNDVIEHLPLAIYEKALGELVRVAKKYVIVTVPFDEDIPGSLMACPSCSCRFNVNYHMRSYKENDVSQLLVPYGGKCLKIEKAVDVVLRPVLFARAIKKFHELRLSAAELLPSYAVCPVCGFSPDARGAIKLATSEAGAASSVSILKRIVRGLLPARRLKREIISLFEK